MLLDISADNLHNQFSFQTGQEYWSVLFIPRGNLMKPKRNRPDHDGKHRTQYDRNRKIIFATQTICALCGKPVDFSIKYPNPMCPTVDHIIPISMGGHPSDLDNMQLAHFKCNRKKGQGLDTKKTPPCVSNRALVLSADWRTS